MSEGTKAILRGDAGTKGFLKDRATEGVRPINQMMSEDALGLDSNMPEAEEICTEVEDYIKNQKINIQSHEVVHSNAERAKEGRAKIMSLSSKFAQPDSEFNHTSAYHGISDLKYPRFIH